MKPVLRTVIDKNGAEETVFEPTSKMILYAIKKAKNQHLCDSEVCGLAKIDPQLPNRWEVKYGSYFRDWLEEAMDMEVEDEAEVLHAVGMMQAVRPGNFQYWREMARTKGVIKEEQPKIGLTLNTDFTVVMAAVGGDFNAARARILQDLRGVGDAGGSRVALPLEPGYAGGDPGPGAGTSQVQERPVALAHALGANGGRAEHREPVSAVPESHSFTSTYEVLDDGEILVGAEE